MIINILRRRNNRDGFMLLEIMVAMAILSISLVLILESLSALLERNREIFDMSIAGLVAQEQLSSIYLREYQKDTTSEKGSGNYPGFDWSVELRPVDEHLDEAFLTVTWVKRRQERKFETTTLLAHSGRDNDEQK